jgi:hypothetical protein
MLPLQFSAISVALCPLYTVEKAQQNFGKSMNINM